MMWLEHAWRDVRYALRMVRRAPVFTAVAVLTLALGIGANTAMFSIVYGILVRSLPYRDADRLVLVQREQDLAGAHRPVPSLFAMNEVDAWRERLRSFDSLASYSIEVAALTTDRTTDVLESAVVSTAFFSTLDGPVGAGRALGTADDVTPSIVISQRLAERLFGGAAPAVGQPLSLSFRSYTIVGVARSDFQFPTAKTDVWMSAGFFRTINPRCCGFRLLGRLKPNITVREASADASTAVTALVPENSFLSRSPLRAKTVTVRDQVVGSARPALLVLFSAVGLVLLVACANVVNLLLVRQVTRSREAAIRSALGATRSRLVEQSIVEVALLASAGAALGIVLASGSIRLLAYWHPPGVPRLDAVQVDMPVLLFSIVLAAAASLAAGLLPAFHAADTADALKLGAGSTTSAPGGHRIRRVLCAAELAISVVLLVGATLLGRSFLTLMRTDLGVSTDHVVTASLNFAFGTRPTDAQITERVERVIERIQTLPGVRAVGAGTALPPNASRLRLTLRATADSVAYQAAGVAATPDYFRALGMRLVKGRFFTADDDLNHPPVIIMGVDTARRFFGDADPIGRSLKMPVLRDGVTQTIDMTLVGVIANVKYAGLDAVADDAVYRPFTQQTLPAPFLAVRTTDAPQRLVAAIGRELAVDRGIVVSDLRPLDSIVADAAASPRFRTEVLGAIAGLALVMAIVGLYGLVSYSVVQRTKEFGIRIAIGAAPRDVLRMVMREGLLVAVVGIASGVAIAIASTRALSGLLYGITPTDSGSFALAGSSLLAIALVATYIPARRATRVDPVVALRDE